MAAQQIRDDQGRYFRAFKDVDGVRNVIWSDWQGASYAHSKAAWADDFKLLQEMGYKVRFERLRVEQGAPVDNPASGLRVMEVPPIAHYPELNAIADAIAKEVGAMINARVGTVQIQMPYRAQYVLEEVLNHLQAAV